MGRHKNTPEQQQAYRERQRAYDRKRRGPGVDRRSPHEKQVKSLYVPEHVLIEREQRLSAPETPNSVLLGDPVVPRWMSK